MRKCLLWPLILVIALFLPLSALAERKQSVLGSIIDGVKQGANDVKQDIQDYKTFVVTIEVINNSNSNQHIEVWDRYKPNPQDFKIILTKEVKPRSTNKWQLEIIPKKGRSYHIQGSGGTDPIYFDPTNQDYVLFTIK